MIKDGSTLINLLYYGVGGSGFSTNELRIYLTVDSNETHPIEQPLLVGDRRYGLDSFMTVPPNTFQPGSTLEEFAARRFNAYSYSRLPLPRAHVELAFMGSLSLLERYTTPEDQGLSRANRIAIPIRIEASA